METAVGFNILHLPDFTSHVDLQLLRDENKLGFL